MIADSFATNAAMSSRMQAIVQETASLVDTSISVLVGQEVGFTIRAHEINGKVHERRFVCYECHRVYANRQRPGRDAGHGLIRDRLKRLGWAEEKMTDWLVNLDDRLTSGSIPYGDRGY